MRNKFSIQVLASITVLALSSGCSDDTSGSAGVPPTPQPKPLPACDQFVKISFKTESKDPIQQRTIRLGYRADSYFHTETFYGNQPHEITVERLGVWADRPYYASVETRFRNGNSKAAVRKFYTPKCDEREEYQRLNPEYAEPIELAD